jgi:hypothetical protein
LIADLERVVTLLVNGERGRTPFWTGTAKQSAVRLCGAMSPGAVAIG